MGILAISKLNCETNRIHEKAVTCVLPHYVDDAIEDALNRRICNTNKSLPFAESVRNVDNHSYISLQSFPEVVSY